jgi:tRNA A-37 threonylcarbamoyl transferase component Bud32
MKPDTPSPFYVAGGTMMPDSPSYIAREADDELYAWTRAGEFCYVLTARQMGKSSLMARTAQRLQQAGVETAVVDLTQIGGAKSGITAEQWYSGIAHAILRQHKGGRASGLGWAASGELHALQRLTNLFGEIARSSEARGTVIFVDEIDATIDLPFSDEFFASIRSCYNARAIDPAFTRLTFVLLGVATPQDLIQDSRQTPFNIGRGVELTDFTINEALPLAKGLANEEERGRALLQRVFYWTGGQPYLTQSVCRNVSQTRVSSDTPEAAVVDPIINRMFFTESAVRDEHNLKFVRARLTAHGPQRKEVLHVYEQAASGAEVIQEHTSRVHAILKLAGVVKADQRGRLRVRNRIYARVFTSEWARRQLADEQKGSFEVEAGSVVGSYRVVDALGEGAQSRVFLARQIPSNAEVAIKQFFPDHDLRKTGARRLIQEVQIRRALHHPNIASVLDYFEQGDSSFLAMEYLPGGSLAEVLARGIEISEEQACRWCRDALRAVHYAHQNGVLHRDLKPANLLLDREGVIKVTDFGVARVFGGAELTQTGAPVGSPAYMSPEQITDADKVYHATDVYSMGVVLYQLLTRALPFHHSDSMFALLAAIVEQPPTPLRQIKPNVSRRVERIVMKALEKDPRNRYGSAEEFALELDGVLQGRAEAPDSSRDRSLHSPAYSAVWRRLREAIFKKLV